MKPYLAQLASNLRLMGRDRSVLFLSGVFPLIFFFIFAQTYRGRSSGGAMAQVIAMALTISVLGNGFFGAGIRTVLDRETNILRRFKVAPINAGPIIVASMISGWAAFMPNVILFLALGKLIYHAPLPAHPFSFFFFLTVGVLAFRSMGMIIAAVVNSQQEASIVIQMLYLPMLFLSGGTFPLEMLPTWLQNVSNFLPATYLFQGMKSIALNSESLLSRANLIAVAFLITAMGLALFIGIKLFRWEKEEKIPGRAKAWILVVLAPFIIGGVYQFRSQEANKRAKQMDRNVARTRSVLFNNVNILVGDGTAIHGGAVLIQNGKIGRIFTAPPADVKSLNAEENDLSGKTLMPGLTDMHVHIGAAGGVYQDAQKYMTPHAEERRLAAYLYSGITAVRSTGDLLDGAMALRKTVSPDGEYQGAQLFTCGPIFTAKGGHPEELIARFPAFMRDTARMQFVREPKTAEEARAQVDELKKAGVDCIKAVLDAGDEHYGKFNRLDADIYRAIAAEAAKQGLPMATHTGAVDDVRLAVEAGSNTIEHGSAVELIPVELFAAMRVQHIAYDPTLSVFEGYDALARGETSLLNRPLLQQVGPLDLIKDTQDVFGKTKKNPGDFRLLDIAKQNLKRANDAGVTLITGTDAGNPMVIHGPTVQHELALWVEDRIPVATALQAATGHAAEALRQASHFGFIRPGLDATFIILDGDALEDIGALEHINMVYLRGEHIDRSDLLSEQFKP